MQKPIESAPREASKLITCVLPDDGSPNDLLEALRQERKIFNGEVVSCLAIGVHSNVNAKPGTVPGTYLAKMVRVVVPAGEADALFEFICDRGHINRDGGGEVYQSALVTSTPFTLPEDVAKE